MRSAVNQANQAFSQAQGTSNTLGGEAQGIQENLTPFLTQEMLHPQGIGQTGLAAKTAAAEAGAGGANSGLMGQANQRASVSRNAGGFSAALDEAAREREKAEAGSSEGIQAGNEQLKQEQMQQGAGGLGKMYGVDTSGMLNAMGQEAPDINAKMNADRYGWIQNWGEIAKDVGESEQDIANAIQMCPAHGSHFLMHDGSVKKVEDVQVGDQLRGIGGDPQTVERIESAQAPILRVITENGFIGRNSRVHAFALPSGGFVVAANAEGKIISTDRGPSKVIAVVPNGVDLVYNVMTDGSHTYLADGLWALGVGEAERHVSMQEWAKIGEQVNAVH